MVADGFGATSDIVVSHYVRSSLFALDKVNLCGGKNQYCFYRRKVEHYCMNGCISCNIIKSKHVGSNIRHVTESVKLVGDVIQKLRNRSTTHDEQFGNTKWNCISPSKHP